MKRELGGAIGAWLVTRTALAVVVLAFAFNVYLPIGEVDAGATPAVLAGLVALSIVTSFGVAAYWQRTGETDRAGALLLVFDLLTVTVGVVFTGAAGSVLTVLYGALIVGATTTLGSRAATLTGGAALAAYLFFGVGIAIGYLPAPPDQPVSQYLLTPRDLGFSVSSNLIAIILVTMLSWLLASQRERVGGALIESEGERRKLAALNDSIVRSIGAGIVTTDEAGTVTSMNQAGRALLALAESPETPLGRVRDFFPELWDPRPGPGRTQSQAIRSDGTTFPAGMSTSRLLDEEARPIGLLIVFQDLTDIQALEKKALEAERLAALGRLSATLAHEIRNPLSAMSGAVELVLENRSLPSEDQRMLHLVSREVERLATLVNVMLDVVKPRVAALVETDLVSLAGDACTMVRAGHPGVEVELEVVGTPRPVIADADMIRQILWNLLRNAVQSSGDSKRIDLRLRFDEGDGFVMAVRDHGEGIPREEQERIFDPFRSNRTRGVGLGLALVKQLVDAHRGTVTVDSEVGSGATFTVEVPKLAPGMPSLRASDA